MLSLDSVKSYFICSSQECKKYLEVPVTLPCGHTICREHFKFNENEESSQNVKFKCDVCSTKHKIQSNNLASNEMASALIDKNIHLSEEQKELKANITKIEAILLDHSKDNPEEYIYDYFANIQGTK